jgi:hypothetical protein
MAAGLQRFPPPLLSYHPRLLQLPNVMDFAVRMAGCFLFSKIDLRKVVPSNASPPCCHPEDSYHHAVWAFQVLENALWSLLSWEHISKDDGQGFGWSGLIFLVPS